MFEKILEAILGLTAAINANTQALGANPTKTTKGKAAAADASQTSGASAANASAAAGTTQQTQATTTAATQTAQATGSPAQQTAQAGASAATTAGAAVTSQTAAQSMIDLANALDPAGKDGRDKAVAILGRYGATGFSGVKPEQWAAFQAECQAALKAHTAPAAAAGGATGLM
jgi:hypothetical protein